MVRLEKAYFLSRYRSPICGFRNSWLGLGGWRTRTAAQSETTGFLKAPVGKHDDRVLGFAGFGVGAGELMATVQLAISAGLAYTARRDLVIAHPTLLEGLVTLFPAVPSA